MDLVESLARHRQELAEKLRRLRVDSDISGSELARRLDWSQSRVSRLETGKQIPTADEVEQFATGLGASRAVVRDLLAHLDGLEQEWSDVRTFQAYGSQQRQEEIKDIEANASEIRVFQHALVPGLLQTPDYTRAIAEVSGVLTDPSDIDADVAVRQERQKALLDKNKQFTFVVTETALWNRYASGFVMHDQCDLLIEVLQSKRVRIGIIPKSARLPLLPLTGFNIYGDDLVTIETITSYVSLRHPSDVDEYKKMFETLASTAVTGKQAQAIVNEVKDSFV